MVDVVLIQRMNSYISELPVVCKYQGIGMLWLAIFYVINKQTCTLCSRCFSQIWCITFAVTRATRERGGAASSLRLETRHAASSGHCVGVGLDEERRDMEWPRCYAGRVGSPSAGGNNRPRVLAPMGYLATSPLRRDVSISGHPLRRFWS